MESIQFIKTTPKELQTEILNGFKSQIEDLKKEFQPKQPTEYLTREETAQLLSITTVTLWRWTNRGTLQSYGIGNKVYYKRKEIEESLILLKK